MPLNTPLVDEHGVTRLFHYHHRYIGRDDNELVIWTPIQLSYDFNNYSEPRLIFRKITRHELRQLINKSIPLDT